MPMMDLGSGEGRDEGCRKDNRTAMFVESNQSRRDKNPSDTKARHVIGATETTTPTSPRLVGTTSHSHF